MAKNNFDLKFCKIYPRGHKNLAFERHRCEIHASFAFNKVKISKLEYDRPRPLNYIREPILLSISYR